MNFMALKDTYQDDMSAFLDATSYLADDFHKALMEGVRVTDEVGRGHLIRLCVTGVKGDWPFLQVVAALERHFRRAPKKGQSNCVPCGVCHLCMAGTPNYPYSDVSQSPSFERTQSSAAARTPWEYLTPFTLKLPSFEFAPALYKPDLFHNWHLGHAKYFISSSLVEMLSLFPGGGVDTRLVSMSSSWRSFCHMVNEKPLLRKFTKEALNCASVTEWPEGCWQKGQTTTTLLDSRPHSGPCLCDSGLDGALHDRSEYGTACQPG